ncbi:hypothetical protein EDB85DRAFT_1888800 [Lactarius pseudohatsudake]|nr:hypothetical protein EDB85DRAFT_1888800 [Lactarius pseudohatsudake]
MQCGVPLVIDGHVRVQVGRGVRSRVRVSPKAEGIPYRGYGRAAESKAFATARAGANANGRGRKRTRREWERERATRFETMPSEAARQRETTRCDMMRCPSSAAVGLTSGTIAQREEKRGKTKILKLIFPSQGREV